MITTIHGSKVEKVTNYNVSTGILSVVLENGATIEDHVTKFRATGGFDEIYTEAGKAERAAEEARGVQAADEVLVYGSDEHLNLVLNIAAKRCELEALADGYVVICNCKDVGWTRSIDEANGWLPGCFAVEIGDGEVVRVYIARGGNESVGAARWEYFAEFTKIGEGGLWERADDEAKAPAPVVGEQPKELTFGEALEALKKGERLARANWNSNEFIFLLPGGDIPKAAIHDPTLRAVMDQGCDGDTFPALPAIRKWGDAYWAQKLLTGWVPTADDLLA